MNGGTDAAVTIPVDGASLAGDLQIPADAEGVVVFAHGSGSSRLSPRNTQVAAALRERGLGTLLFDLLTEAEDETYRTRFDIDLLTGRLLAATDWLRDRDDARDLALGYFGASTGAAAALRAAAGRDDVAALVSRGGRVDLALGALPRVRAATLFVVGGEDVDVLELNREAFEELTCERELAVVDGAGHLFDGPGELEEVAALAGDWFADHLD